MKKGCVRDWWIRGDTGDGGCDVRVGGWVGGWSGVGMGDGGGGPMTTKRITRISHSHTLILASIAPTTKQNKLNWLINQPFCASPAIP